MDTSFGDILVRTCTIPRIIIVVGLLYLYLGTFFYICPYVVRLMLFL